MKLPIKTEAEFTQILKASTLGELITVLIACEEIVGPEANWCCREYSGISILDPKSHADFAVIL